MTSVAKEWQLKTPKEKRVSGFSREDDDALLMSEICGQSIPETAVGPCNFRAAIRECGKSPVAKVAAKPIEMQPIITRVMSNAFKGVPVKRWPIT